MSEKSKSCFVVSPIGADGSDHRTHADWVYEGIILPVMQEHYPEFIVERADKINDPGLIDQQIIQRIIRSDLVIADLSFGNPNVFYEVGLRHMYQKPIVHMVRKQEDLPFDVKLQRTVHFSYTRVQDVEAAKSQLHDVLKEVVKEGFKQVTPVTLAVGRIEIDKTADASEKVILSQIDAILSRIARLELRAKNDTGASFLGGKLEPQTSYIYYWGKKKISKNAIAVMKEVHSQYELRERYCTFTDDDAFFVVESDGPLSRGMISFPGLQRTSGNVMNYSPDTIPDFVEYVRNSVKSES
jgi:hypothetical protein